MVYAIALLQQTIDPTQVLLHQYGLWGVIVWLIFRDLVPFLKEQFSASHKARIAQQEEERRIRAAREEKLTTVLEQFGSQLHTFGLAMTVVTERLTAIERDQDIVMRTVEILADRKQQDRSQQRQRGG